MRQQNIRNASSFESSCPSVSRTSYKTITILLRSHGIGIFGSWEYVFGVTVLLSVFPSQTNHVVRGYSEEMKPTITYSANPCLKQQKIIPIPATPTAADIFAEFGGDDFEPFFNKVLSSKLLYKFERPMFADFLRQFRNDQVDTDAQRYPNGAPPPASVYGYAHLVSNNKLMFS